MFRTISAVVLFTLFTGASVVYAFSAKTDTLVYHDYFEDPTQPTYILNGLNSYWITVRFTPEAEFTASSVHFLAENLIGSIDPCYLYLVLDKDGQPDPDSILAGPIMVEGPLPNLEMIKVELDSGIVVDSLRDFHVMISSGGLSSYSVALELPSDFPERTGHTPNSHVGPFYGYEFPTMADAIIAVEGHYPGEQQDQYDLETNCLSNGIDLFFPDAQAALGLTFWSEVTNNGPDSAPEYTLTWLVLDETDSLVFQYDTVQPPLPPGETVTISCPNQWATVIEGDYVVRDSVLAEGETDFTNNSSYLEQHVQVTRGLNLKYCDGEPEETYVIQEGFTYGVRFVPWSRVATVDSIAIYFMEESICRISVLDGFYHDELPGEVLFTSDDLIFPEGWSMVNFQDPITPTRSTFFIALTSISGSSYLGLDSDIPLTSHSCLPEQFFKSADFLDTWQPIITDDPMMEVFILKKGHPSHKYVEILSCEVRPDEVLPGETVKVRVKWEFLDIFEDEPLDFWIISGLAAYPSMVPIAVDTLRLQNVHKGLHLDTMNFILPENLPGGIRGISAAFITSSSSVNLSHSLSGNFFQTLHKHHVISDSL